MPAVGRAPTNLVAGLFLRRREAEPRPRRGHAGELRRARRARHRVRAADAAEVCRRHAGAAGLVGRYDLDALARTEVVLQPMFFPNSELERICLAL